MRIRIVKPTVYQFRKAIKFIPLLVLYIIIVLVFSNDSQQGDEGRYIGYAYNLLNGFYSPHGVDINLWNGPGYPIILVPFFGFHIPPIFAKLLNAVFLFLAVIYFYFTLSLFVRERVAIIFAYLFGLYFPMFPNLPLLLTEIFAVFLSCGFIFHFCKWSRGIQRRSNLVASAVFLGYLALTKVFFGFVILAGMVIFLLLSLIKLRRNLPNACLLGRQGSRVFLSALPVYLGAFLVCIPYLIYTYALTGKTFYWGNAGGMSLYWTSTLDDNEFGETYISEWVLIQTDFPSHKEFLSKIVTLPLIRQDEELKKQALKNIRSNPKKYVINCMSNMGRMWFSFPYSYTKQKLSTFFYIIPNMFLLVLLIFCLYPYFARLSLGPPELHSLVLFGAITFFGSSLLGAYPRQLFPIVPVILLFIAFIGTNVLRIEVRK